MLVQKLEMGYCPLSMRQARRCAGWVLGAGAQGLAQGRAAGGSAWQAAQRGRAGARGAQRMSGVDLRGARLGERGTADWAAWVRSLGVLLGQWAVYLVHSACFDPV